MVFRHPIVVTVLVTSLVTLITRTLPESMAATAVGLVFLGSTYFLSVSHATNEEVRGAGLALGGILETGPIDAFRLVRAAATAAAWALGAALIVFPPFWIAFIYWWHPAHDFVWKQPGSWSDELLGQALVIALPEEAFYRGYLLSTLEKPEQPEHRHTRIRTALNLIASSALFALGHFATEPYPARFAVFFPALLFGWLRLRTGGIGAGVIFHVACNVFASILGRGYGLF